MRMMFFAIGLMALPLAAAADESVEGYDRQDGTYVEPYVRTDPNDTPTDNYSYPGNDREYVNPDSNREWQSDPGSQPYSGSPPGTGGPANGSTLWGQ
jgi:hypothetical protein